MAKDILLVGCGDFTDVDMLLMNGVEGDRIVATELRSHAELFDTYGLPFMHTVEKLQKAGVQLVYEFNALDLRAVDFLAETTHVFWFSPHFGAKNKGRFPDMLQQFFSAITEHAPKLELVMLALDCKSPDGLYNLNTRFGAFNIQSMHITAIVDLRSAYRFAPTNPQLTTHNGRAQLENLQSEVVQGLVYKKAPPAAIKAERDKHSATEIFFRPDDESMIINSYQTLFRFPCISWQDFCRSHLLGLAPNEPEQSFASLFRPPRLKDGRYPRIVNPTFTGDLKKPAAIPTEPHSPQPTQRNADFQTPPPKPKKEFWETDEGRTIIQWMLWLWYIPSSVQPARFRPTNLAKRLLSMAEPDATIRRYYFEQFGATGPRYMPDDSPAAPSRIQPS